MGWTNSCGSVYHYKMPLAITVRKVWKKTLGFMTYEFRKLHGIVGGSLWGKRERRSPWTWGSAFIGVEGGGLGFQNVHSLLMTLKYEWQFKVQNRKSLNKTKIKKSQRLVNKLKLSKTSGKKKKKKKAHWGAEVGGTADSSSQRLAKCLLEKGLFEWLLLWSGHHYNQIFFFF